MNKLKKIFQLLTLSGLLILILSFFGNYFYFFDLLSHFYLQYFFIGLILLISNILLKEKVLSLLCLTLIAFLGFNISKADIINEEYNGDVDYYYMNSNYHVNSPEAIVENIKKYNPKYVAVVELNENLHETIKRKLNYENIVYHSDGVSSIGFYTNKEILKQELHELTFPVMEIKTVDGTVFIVHPLPPINYELSILHKQNLSEIKELFNKNTDTDKMILGDLNSSFYSSVFKKYFGELYYKPIYSWGNTGILRLPIDYVIGNNEFFEAYGVDLNISDHSPLIIKLK